MKNEIKVCFVGNPNCGKTTLFNAYTGANLKVANWPGVTVEKKEGYYRYKNLEFTLVDLPGIYSLTCYTMEEKLTREYILESNAEIIVNIVDASSLERNLYLTLQLLEMGKPVVLVLNMMDIVEDRGMKIDIKKLSGLLGIPVIPVSARRRIGLDKLIDTVSWYYNGLKNETAFMPEYQEAVNYEIINNKLINYSYEIEDKINRISQLLHNSYNDIPNIRWYSIKILESDIAILHKYPVDLSGINVQGCEDVIINQKYDFIEKIINDVLMNKRAKAAATDKIDRILTNRYLGLPVFLMIMAMVFILTFKIGGFLKRGLEILLELCSEAAFYLLQSIHAGEFVTSLVVDGIITGVGGILTFLPIIFILFLALAYLEDSGYMARVAFVMDGIMSKLGLSGKAFIPMLLGFGCSVPAIMASRSLENMEDRRRTILITPFISCSARLPVYVLFSQMFFGDMAMFVAYSMYLIGIFAAITIAFIMKNNSENNRSNSLLIELPEYKIPNQRTIFIYVWEKIREYLTKAGTTIFAASVVIWLILNLGPQGLEKDMSQSFGAIIGKAAAPLLTPAGLGMWQIVVALISGIAAKEVVVSSFGVLFHMNNITSPQSMTCLADILSRSGFGALNAYSLMVFCLLYVPCVATLGVIMRELRSVKWTLFIIIFQLGVAMLMATLVYQIGSVILELFV